jgi:hypothetical protein
MPLDDIRPSRLRRGLRVLRELHAAAQRYDIPHGRLVRHLALLEREHGLRPREAHHDGLSNPRLTGIHLSGVIQKKRLVRLQDRLNPDEFAALGRDKGVFHAYCTGLGLAVPEVHGVFDRRTGWSENGRRLVSAQQWEGELERLADDFVVKPTVGTYGEGVRVYAREAVGFRDLATGQALDAATIVSTLSTDPRGRYLVQRRLRCHPEITNLTGSQTLQTARIQSLVTEDGECVIAGCSFKLCGGRVLVDNIVGGTTGNFLASVRVEDGTLRAAVAFSPSGLGVERLDRHPTTAEPIAGRCFPFWDEAKALVRRASLLFLPLRTIGWDVALTPAGPVLVEANVWWDPFNFLCALPEEKEHAAEMAALLARLRDEAARAVPHGSLTW